MARLKQLVVYLHHPASLARFWAEALDDFEVRPYDDAEVAHLDTLGFTPETDPGVILDGPMLEVCFQKVDVAVTAKKPLHMDLATSDRPSETTRLVALGASVKEQFASHTSMRDPEGNDFCITDA
ncbi:MAG: VOC family protein [Acidimicrobiales bacterium]|nr:VOC family protein [Acidimicrobiales bacterium]